MFLKNINSAHQKQKKKKGVGGMMALEFQYLKANGKSECKINISTFTLILLQW